MRYMVHILVSIVALCLVTVAQSQSKPCPAVSMTTTKDTVIQGSIIVFKIKLSGKLLKPRYDWTVSAGNIISGQGTANIKADSRELADEYITATIEVVGLNTDSSECRKISSASVYVKEKIAVTPVPCLLSNGKYIYTDRNLKPVIAIQFDTAINFHEGLANVMGTERKCGYINTSGKTVIPFIYTISYRFREGVGIVGIDGKYGYVDKEGKLIIPVVYEACRNFYDSLARVFINGKWGFIDKRGVLIIPAIYDNAISFSEGLAAVKMNNKWGFVDKKGVLLIPAVYDDVEPFSEKIAAIKKDGKWGFIDKTQNWIIQNIYDDTYGFFEGLARIQQNGKWGFMDKQGKWIIPAAYESAGDFSENMAAIKITGKWGYINKDGLIVIPPYYEIGEKFEDGIARVTLNENGKVFRFYIDKTGKEYRLKTELNIEKMDNANSPVPFLKKNGKFIYVDRNMKPLIIKEFDKAELFDKGIAKVWINKKAGFINQAGEEVISVKYDYLGDFRNGLAWAELGNTRGLINRQGVFIMTTPYYSTLNSDVWPSDGLVLVCRREGLLNIFGFIDLQGQVVIPLNLDLANDFSEGLAVVEQSGKWGYIDKSGKTIIPFQYQSANSFFNGVAIVEINGKYGLINKSGKFLTPPNYSFIGYFSEGLVAVSINTANGKKTGYCNLSGRQVIPYDYEDGEEFSEGIARVKKFGMWGYIDKTGKNIIPFSYKIASSFSEGLAAVKQLDGKQGYIDRNNKWVISLNFEGSNNLILRGDFHNGLAFLTFSRQEANSTSFWGFYIDKTGREFREK